MPVTHETEVLYSTEELSQIFQVPHEEITKVVTEKKFNQHNVNGGSYLKKDELESFVEELLLSLGLSHKYYEIPDFLKNCSAPWANTLVKMYQNKITCPASISPTQGDFLKTLVCNIAPKNILEIGCFTGISTIWMAAGLEQIGNNGTIHSIDLFVDIMPRIPVLRAYLPNPLEYAQKSVENAQLSHRVKFYKNNSVAVGEKFNEILNEPIDFLYIDGDHTIDGCYKDFMLFYPHVSVGGYIVLHDIYPEFCGWDGPRYVIDKFIKNSPHFDLLEVKTSPINFGMAVIRKLSQDKNLELRSQLTNTPIWQSIKGKPIGNLIKKTILQFK